MSQPIFKLSPSDFAFLWRECKRCFYLKVVNDFRRPSIPFPRIFNIIDAEMKKCFEGRNTHEILPDLPAGTIALGDKWVKSTPISVPGHQGICFIRGKLDSVIRCDDGSYAVVDFKTSTTKAEHVDLYSRQLHAYAYALEHAAPGSLALVPIPKLGLIVFEPTQFSDGSSQNASLSGTLTWLEIPKDEGGFLGFLGDVLEVLGLPSPPQAPATCGWCNYREDSRKRGV